MSGCIRKLSSPQSTTTHSFSVSRIRLCRSASCITLRRPLSSLQPGGSFDRATYTYISSASSRFSRTFSMPGLKAGLPKNGQLPHRKASPLKHYNARKITDALRYNIEPKNKKKASTNLTFPHPDTSWFKSFSDITGLSSPSLSLPRCQKV